jgi:pimeloyl-ACP methyl ester carboxylesterase
LGRLSPSTAARLLARIFCTVPRRPLAPEEARCLAAARNEAILVGRRQAVLACWGTPGPVALLVHGWAGRGGQFAPFVQPLLDQGFQVVAYDAPAHGAAPGRTSSLPELIATLQAVARRFPPQALVAHSVGAAAATVAMADGLAPERAVFLAPVDDPWSFLERLAAELALPPEVARRVRSGFERRFGVAAEDLVAARRAGGLTASLLVLHDVADREVPLAHGQRLAAAWRGARLEITRGLGHRRILADPAVVAAAVGFLDPRSRADDASARTPPRASASPGSDR